MNVKTDVERLQGELIDIKGKFLELGPILEEKAV
jgi:hypothetical protein